ncbi:MAG: GNAT family protein [Halanaerobium sp.]|nr:GNAT family protein [Halanaerobium sp.]
MIYDRGLLIRNVEKKDIPLLKAWDNPGARGPFQEYHFSSFKNLEDRYERDGFNSDENKVLLVEEEDGDPIGLIYVNLVRDGIARLGLVICEPEYRNKGCGQQVTRMIIGHLIDNYPLARIEADTDVENYPARRVLESTGFQQEGILRNYRYHHGQWRDFALYSLLPLKDLDRG